MKRCPTCDHVEKDETLKFCRIDGTLLVAAAAFEFPLPWLATLNIEEAAAMAERAHYLVRAGRCCKEKHKQMSYT
jgi:hypothetical protein